MEINDLLQEVKLSEQVLMIAGRYAGRDMQNNINGDKIEQASGQLCTDVIELVEKNVTGLDKILSYTPLNFVMLRHCYLQINEYDRIDVYYKGSKIGSTRFNYTLSIINKETLNKVFQKLPEFIKTIVDHLFNHSGLDLKYFKQQYDPEVKRKEESRFKGFNLFNKKEIEKATKHINDEMDEYAEELYNNKKDKEKDDGFEL